MSNIKVRHSIVYQAPVDTPPIVIVDNNPGFIAYGPTPYGYKNTSLSYSNIHEAMGINFYATGESIGACIFKEGNLISITDSTIENFFTLSPDHDVEISLVSVMQVTEDIIYVAAIMNLGGGNILFSSKTISYEGLLLSIPTSVEHFTTTATEKAMHRTIFDENGSLIGPSDEEEYYAYEEYNGSHGFGDMKIKEIDLSGGDESAMTTIMDEVKNDISTLVDSAAQLSSNVYSIESFSSKDSLFIVALTKDDVSIISIIPGEDDDLKTIPLSKDNKQTKFDNVYSKSIAYITPKGTGKTKVYKKVYTPAGVIKRYDTFSRIAFNRIEDVTIGGLEFKGMGSYELRVKTNDDGESEIDFDSFAEEGEDAYPSEEIKFNVNNYDDLRYVFYARGRTINNHIGDTEAAASNKEVVHVAFTSGTLSNQKVDIISVKSMSSVMMYGSLSEEYGV